MIPADWPGSRFSKPLLSSSPFRKVQEIVIILARVEFRDRREHTLELRFAHAVNDSPDKFTREPFFHAFFRRNALIDKQVQHLVHIGIGKTQLAFISLPRPKDQPTAAW